MGDLAMMLGLSKGGEKDVATGQAYVFQHEIIERVELARAAIALQAQSHCIQNRSCEAALHPASA